MTCALHLKAVCPVSVVCPPSILSIKPSPSCGPFRGQDTMFQAGKKLVEELEKDNPNLSPLAWAHSYLMEHPFMLFVAAAIFL